MNEKILNLNERTPTWENIGVDVTNARSLESVMAKAGLNYEVEKKPIEIQGTGLILPDKVATVRTYDNHPYGIVSNKYSVIQNREAFDFMNYINGDLEYVKAGETAGGMIYIIGKLPEQYILDDKFTPYVIFRNSFNGRYPIQSAIVPLRIVCQNQFNTAFKNSDNTINIRHSRNADVKMAEAQEILRKTAEHMNVLGDFAEEMVKQKVSESAVNRLIDSMFETGEDASKRLIDNMEADRSSFLTAYHAPDNANFVGTKWGLINAFTDFQSHKPIQRNTDTAVENRFMTVCFDPTAMTRFVNRMNAVA